jgi:hypothetical protein
MSLIVRAIGNNSILCSRMPWSGNECGKKNKVMRISRQPFPVKRMIDQKQLENVELF